ncbi:MAG TPA: inositol monophosphatase family protein [Anaerolineales bacterium]|nr:inositol monophosphatase family protein [Anaerolineales bacterium]
MTVPLPLPVSTRWDGEARFAFETMQASFRILEAIGPATSKPVLKYDWTPVTVADFAIQAAAAGLLSEHFPDDALEAEEDAGFLQTQRGMPMVGQATQAVRTIHPDIDEATFLTWLANAPSESSQRKWVLDPIDGTIGLIQGRQYVTAMALIERGHVVLGAMACPKYAGFGEDGCVTLAIRGEGAWAIGRRGTGWTRLQMKPSVDGRHSRLIRSVEGGWKARRRLTKIRKGLEMDAEEIRLDSQVKYLALSAGDGDLVVRLPRKQGTRKENVWDHAAGTITVEEAGGTVSDVRGEALDFGRGAQLEGNLGVVASVTGLHGRAIEAIRPVLTERELRS